MRKETIERVFGDAKEKHAMRYTHHRGLVAVTRWVRLKYVAMNLKKLAEWRWKQLRFTDFCVFFLAYRRRIAVSLLEIGDSFTGYRHTYVWRASCFVEYSP